MTPAAHRPNAVVFDVNETLVDLAGLRPTFEEFNLPLHAPDWWFATLLRDGFALAAAGDIAPFPSLAHAALDEIFATVGRSAPSGSTATLLAAFAQLPLYRDVAPAFERLSQAGVRTFALTNGSASTTQERFERAGLTSFVERVLSVDTIEHWKPRAEPYLYVARETNVAPERLAMVAVHPWDLNGAAAAGLVTAWINRYDRKFPDVFRHPHVEASSLDVVVERLLGLPE